MPGEVRAPYYMSVVWGLVVVQAIAEPFFFGQGFDYATIIASPIVVLVSLFTGGFGMAKALQDHVDTRRFRKQIEEVKVNP